MYIVEIETKKNIKKYFYTSFVIDYIFFEMSWKNYRRTTKSEIASKPNLRLCKVIIIFYYIHIIIIYKYVYYDILDLGGIIENKFRSHKFYFKYLWHGSMQLAGAV